MWGQMRHEAEEGAEEERHSCSHRLISQMHLGECRIREQTQNKESYAPITMALSGTQ